MADEQNEQAQQNEQQQDGQQADNQQVEALTFDKWLAGQDDGIKDLLDDHTAGLKSALDDERRERKSLAARIKELSKSAENGSELQQQLDALTTQMGEADTKTAFYEAAHEAGVKNLRLAWTAAREFDLVNSKGAVDMAQLKSIAPELFASKSIPVTNGGNGANQSGAVVPDMNKAIRAMAGMG